MFDDEIPKLLSRNFYPRHTFISDDPEQIEQEESQPVTTTLNYQIAVPAVAAPGPVPPSAVPLPPPVAHPPPAVAPPRQPPETKELLNFPEPPEILLESDSDFEIEETKIQQKYSQWSIQEECKKREQNFLSPNFQNI